MFMKTLHDGIEITPRTAREILEELKPWERPPVVVKIGEKEFTRVFAYQPAYSYFGYFWRGDDGKYYQLKLHKGEYQPEEEKVVEVPIEEVVEAAKTVLKAEEEWGEYVKTILNYARNLKVQEGGIIITWDKEFGDPFIADAITVDGPVAYFSEIPLVEDIDSFLKAYSKWLKELHRRVYPKIKEIQEKYGVELIR